MEPSRTQAACVASSWATSQPPPSPTTADAARTGAPSSNRRGTTSSTTTSMPARMPAPVALLAAGLAGPAVRPYARDDTDEGTRP
jgi:hypothetical protein